MKLVTKGLKKLVLEEDLKGYIEKAKSTPYQKLGAYNELQEKARKLGKGYHYGGYQGL